MSVPHSYSTYQELTDIANHLVEIAEALHSTNALRSRELDQIAHHVAALRGVSNGPKEQPEQCPVCGWVLHERDEGGK